MQNSEGRNMSVALMIFSGALTLVTALFVPTAVIGLPAEQAPLARLLNGVDRADGSSFYNSAARIRTVSLHRWLEQTRIM